MDLQCVSLEKCTVFSVLIFIANVSERNRLNGGLDYAIFIGIPLAAECD